MLGMVSLQIESLERIANKLSQAYNQSRGLPVDLIVDESEDPTFEESSAYLDNIKSIEMFQDETVNHNQRFLHFLGGYNNFLTNYMKIRGPCAAPTLYLGLNFGRATHGVQIVD